MVAVAVGLRGSDGPGTPPTGPAPDAPAGAVNILSSEPGYEDMGDGSERDDGDATSPATALSHPTRRRVVELLCDADGGEKGMVLVLNAVARFKAETDLDVGESVELGAVRDELEADHLPALEAAGLVRHDEAADAVELAVPEAAARRRLADAAPSTECEDDAA